MPPPSRAYTVAIDTREQKPYEWEGLKCQRVGLPTGDYSLVELPQAVVERKSLPDMYGCLTRGRRRFEDCLGRLSVCLYPLVVLECHIDDLLKPFTYVSGGIEQVSRVPPSVAQNSILSWQARFRVPFLLCGSRAVAQRMTLQHLDLMWRMVTREQRRRDRESPVREPVGG